jgi:hypothetical protein
MNYNNANFVPRISKSKQIVRGGGGGGGVDGTKAVLRSLGLGVAEDHLLDEQSRLRRPTRRPRRRLPRGHLHGHLSIRKCSSKRGIASVTAPPRRDRGHPPDTLPLSLAEHRSGIEAARKAQGGCREGESWSACEGGWI